MDTNYFENIAIDGIDLLKGQEHYPGKAYHDVLRTWYIHTSELIKQLRNPVKEPFDHDALHTYTINIHSLKGSSYGIFADGIGKKAENLEAAARRGDMEFITANNEPLMAETAVVLQQLEKLFARIAENSKKTKPLCESPDPALLSGFLDACRQYKSSLMDEILDKLDAYRYETGGELVQWLRTQTDNLEYDAINERLEKEITT